MSKLAAQEKRMKLEVTWEPAKPLCPRSADYANWLIDPSYSSGSPGEGPAHPDSQGKGLRISKDEGKLEVCYH